MIILCMCVVYGGDNDAHNGSDDHDHDIYIYIYHNNASDNNIDTGTSNLLPCIFFEC